MSLSELLLSFKGRINRGKLWAGVGILLLISIIGYLAIVYLIGEPFGIANMEAFAQGADPEFFYDPPALTAYGVLSIVSGFMSFAVMAKRCHDRGKSGWWSLISLIPIAGFIWFLIDLGIMEGDAGPNRFGPNPLGPRMV